MLKKKNINKKKLDVDLETVRSLSQKELENVPGAGQANNSWPPSNCCRSVAWGCY